MQPDDPSEDDAPPSPAAAFAEVSQRLHELRDYAAYYLATRIDKIKLAARNAVLYALLGIVGLIVAVTVVIMSVVLLCLGIAGGLGALFGMRPWLGYLVAGMVMLGGIGLALFLGMKQIARASKKRTVNAYEQRKRQQRTDHGIDVDERAQN